MACVYDRDYNFYHSLSGSPLCTDFSLVMPFFAAVYFSIKNLEERLFFDSALREFVVKTAFSLRLKIVVSILAIIIVSNLFLVLFLYGKSKSELVSSILKSSGQSAHSTALEIGSINDLEYKMLSSLAGLPVIRDDNVDLKEKWNIINAVVKGNDSYIGMAIYDEYGVGWTTTGKYQDLHTRG